MAIAREVERWAEARPKDANAQALVHLTHRFAACGDGVPGVVSGIRRERLVRWDRWSSTWDGYAIDSGRPARVRVLAATARTAMHERALRRTARALADVVDTGWAEDWPALTTLLPGVSLAPDDTAPPHPPHRVASRLCQGLGALSDWEQTRVCPVEVRGDSLLQTHDGIAIVSLTPAPVDSITSRIAELAATILEWAGPGDDPARTAARGLALMPPASIEDATAVVVEGMAQLLADQRHRAARGLRRVMVQTSATRLLALVERLRASQAPPTGRAALGVDLDGQVTILEGRDEGLYWGPVDDTVVVARDSRIVDARRARRALRARAAAPPNPRLDAEVNGDPAFGEAACRWMAGALELRTLAMLLGAPG